VNKGLILHILIFTAIAIVATYFLRDTKDEVFKITAYCNCSKCSGIWGNITKTGIKPYLGICAVDPKVIPLGSYVYIERLGMFKAEDIGSKIKGRTIDVYMSSHQRALDVGVQYLRARIIK
jgi:3D (Asp-Asp-Asp) domain-containing protein